jgi:hypothetical protein
MDVMLPAVWAYFLSDFLCWVVGGVACCLAVLLQPCETTAAAMREMFVVVFNQHLHLPCTNCLATLLPQPRSYAVISQLSVQQLAGTAHLNIWRRQPICLSTC